MAWRGAGGSAAPIGRRGGEGAGPSWAGGTRSGLGGLGEARRGQAGTGGSGGRLQVGARGDRGAGRGQEPRAGVGPGRQLLAQAVV